MDHQSKPALIPDQLKETVPDSFIAVPRDTDTAVVYWSLSNRHLPFHEGGRLCLQIIGQTSDLTDTIILHRESGHFIIPLLAEEREYEIQLGWSDVNGFTMIFTESIILPDLPENPLGAHSSAMDYRGSVFWGHHQNSAN
ncbi:MAG: hypothetical protein P1V20_30950 [Verrucomicrobiales bacterium]|nr:hypothetical protein [Verrucomicrobiales bacterium]